MDIIEYIKNEISKKEELLRGRVKGKELFNPPTSIQHVEQFEREHHISLPQDYKRFITEIGNGGVGPELGLVSLDYAIVDFKLRSRPLISLEKEFAYQNEWNESWIETFNWDEDYPPEAELVGTYFDTSHISGCLQIGEFGHSCTSLLVINGKEYGNMWNDFRADYGGIVPILDENNCHITFGKWYADWITSLI